MQATLLGSGDALGVPAPMCACEYCSESNTRHRPGLMVEHDTTTIVLDTSPDLRHQLAAVGQPDVDAFFVTHHHYDHVGGLKELNHAAIPFTAHLLNSEELPSDDYPPDPTFEVFMTATARVHLNYRGPRERLAPAVLNHGDPVSVGDLSVVPFPVDHARPDFDTIGFAVHEGAPEGPPAVVYAPDMWRFLPNEAHGDAYRDAAVLFAEGSALLGVESHGETADLEAALADADANRTVLVNASEHLARAHTTDLEQRAGEYGYELGVDFKTYTVP